MIEDDALWLERRIERLLDLRSTALLAGDTERAARILADAHLAAALLRALLAHRARAMEVS